MKNKIVILQASSRNNGDTSLVVNYLNSNNNFDILDLNKYQINHFDYSHKNKDDDFISLMRMLISNYNTFVFATPVYWYSMSGILKVFFDRITDLLTVEKDLGRQLRGKNMAMLSVSNDNDLNEHFNLPFRESANYLGMHYLGNIHTWIENKELSDEVKLSLDIFKKSILFGS